MIWKSPQVHPTEFTRGPVMPLGSQAGSLHELHQLLPERITEFRVHTIVAAQEPGVTF